MKAILAFLVMSLSLASFAQSPQPVTLRSILLEQLKTTHNAKDWFVPISVATDGLTPEQVNWKDGKGNHSVGQLAYHVGQMIFVRKLQGAWNPDKGVK